MLCANIGILWIKNFVFSLLVFNIVYVYFYNAIPQNLEVINDSLSPDLGSEKPINNSPQQLVDNGLSSTSNIASEQRTNQNVVATPTQKDETEKLLKEVEFKLSQNQKIITSIKYVSVTEVVKETGASNNKHKDYDKSKDDDNDEDGDDNNKIKDKMKNLDKHNEHIESIRKDEPIASMAMFACGLVTTSLNLVACVYLLTKSYKVGKVAGFHSTLRMMIYSVIADMFCGLFFTISIVYSTLFDHLIQGTGCSFVGFIINTLTASDMLLIAFVTIDTYFKAVKNFKISTGRGDWIILSLCFGMPLLISAVLAQFHAFGPELYWCLVDEETTGGKISTLGTVCLHFLVAIIVIVTFLGVKRYNSINTGNKFNKNIYFNSSILMDGFVKKTSINTISSKYSKKIYRSSVLTTDYAEIKLSTHLYIHFIQYTPPIVHMICMLNHYKLAWVFAIAIVSTNMGGVLQFLAYKHHHHVKKHKFQHHYLDTSHSNNEKSKLRRFSKFLGIDGINRKLTNFISHKNNTPPKSSNLKDVGLYDDNIVIVQKDKY